MADVLLVDDNGSVLLTLAIALRRRGHKVTVADDAHEALTYLRRHNFGFLVSDVRMPGMSGLELAAQVQSLPRPPRVILTSAYSNVEAREGTATAFLRKPIDIQELHSLLCDQSATGSAAQSSAQNSTAQGSSPANSSSAGAQARAQSGPGSASTHSVVGNDGKPRHSHHTTYDPAFG